jgi:lantibiotic modifying enzyme
MSILKKIIDVKEKYSSTGALNAVKTIFNTQDIHVKDKAIDNIIVTVKGADLQIRLVEDHVFPDDSQVVLETTKGMAENLVIHCTKDEIIEMKLSLQVAHRHNPNISRKDNGN